MEKRMSSQTSDTTRLRYLMREIDGFVNVKGDRYDYAMMVAADEGREVPTEQDELDGFRRMIDCALEGGDK
jgi:hypothetical protein